MSRTTPDEFCKSLNQLKLLTIKLAKTPEEKLLVETMKRRVGIVMSTFSPERITELVAPQIKKYQNNIINREFKSLQDKPLPKDIPEEANFVPALVDMIKKYATTATETEKQIVFDHLVILLNAN
jgi:hypothetical protein